jgi:glycerol uptake facilitator-like aquaporin
VPAGALVLEGVLTALLMLVIMSVATDTRAVGAPAALAIAAAVGLAALAFGPLTGASLNTARSFGPALAAGQWQEFWVYLVGPLLGAPAGALAYQYVRGELAQPPGAPDYPQNEKTDGDHPVRLPA